MRIVALLCFGSGFFLGLGLTLLWLTFVAVEED